MRNEKVEDEHCGAYKWKGGTSERSVDLSSRALIIRFFHDTRYANEKTYYYLARFARSYTYSVIHARSIAGVLFIKTFFLSPCSDARPYAWIM